MDKDLRFQLLKPRESLAGFVESFWMLQNKSGNDKEIIILPDGRIDLTFSLSAAEPFHITLSGLETYPEPVMLQPGMLIFAVSFKLPATEYIFHSSISNLLNYAAHLPADFWDFNAGDLDDFDLFHVKASNKITALLPAAMDERKRRLFELLYASNGEISVQELSERSFWSSRQINRYFNQQYGITLKLYCNILRFRASLNHLATGELFPALNFSDQSHFIKAIKKFSGVVPKELLENRNDRFIQFSVLAS